MTHPLNPEPGASALDAMRRDSMRTGDDIESELFASAREAGVACFLATGPDLDADAGD
jgi:hypothetical protein